MSNPYEQNYERSMQDPEGFWGDQAEACHWFKRWDRVLDDANPPFYRWFSGGKINTCYNALDFQIEQGRGQQPALIYDSPVTDTVQTLTYLQLRDQVARFAGVLAEHGIQKGDRVIIYMPMIPQALIAMYACARLDRKSVV